MANLLDIITRLGVSRTDHPEVPTEPGTDSEAEEAESWVPREERSILGEPWPVSGLQKGISVQKEYLDKKQ